MACVVDLDGKQAGARGGASFLGGLECCRGRFAMACDARWPRAERGGQMSLYGCLSANSAIGQPSGIGRLSVGKPPFVGNDARTSAS